MESVCPWWGSGGCRGYSLAVCSLLEGSAAGQDLRGAAFQVRGLKAWGGAWPAWLRGRVSRLRSGAPASQVRLHLQTALACSLRPEQGAVCQAAMESVPLMRVVCSAAAKCLRGA